MIDKPRWSELASGNKWSCDTDSIAAREKVPQTWTPPF